MSKEGIAVDLNKVAVILTLPIPERITSVKGFLGSTSYYCRFIHFYAEIAKPLTHFTKQTDTPGVWTEECTKAFNKLKE